MSAIIQAKEVEDFFWAGSDVPMITREDVDLFEKPVCYLGALVSNRRVE
ncbi:hypothetical protein JOD24_000141 [Kroppenstedtia sanguinis]|uniref:Uncharacterized protein n=1 Tax=Kroppenstedtia sanguinis TaxID=1380684 RepID=A0ABW4C5A1_9BACL